MITYEKLSKKPSAFKSMVGLTVEEFDQLNQDLFPAYQSAERQRLSRPNRKRAIGAGHQYSLPFRDRLLMTVIHLRLYPTREVLGFLFGIDKGTISRNVRRMMPLLDALGRSTFGWPQGEQRQHTSLDEVIAACPDLLAIVDATEQRIERPRDQTTQKAHY